MASVRSSSVFSSVPSRSNKIPVILHSVALQDADVIANKCFSDKSAENPGCDLAVAGGVAAAAYITKKKLEKIVDSINAVAPECFCERLVSNTFHMTLHDLSSSPVLEDVAVELFYNELKAVKIAEKIAEQKIKMKSKYIFNMVNTSLVMGLYPTDEEEYNKIMANSKRGDKGFGSSDIKH